MGVCVFVCVCEGPWGLDGVRALSMSGLTGAWCRREVSNYEYLMHLNTLAGRSFNDLSAYPVFPWVLSDYTSEHLDLTQPSVFRDLSKPVGALNPAKLAVNLRRFQEMDPNDPTLPPFHYGTHYSTPAYVLYYLLRVEPYTALAYHLQDGSFDHPDRLFSSLAHTWHGVWNNSADVKELIPEMFTLPELFLNLNHLPLGQTQQGEAVDDVILPPWAKGSPDLFCSLHLMALESDYVSTHLHQWIDLIFGYKQRGKEAEAAHNLFMALTYEDHINWDDVALSPQDKRRLQSQVEHFGQTPSQLFTQPHPRRPAKQELSLAQQKSSLLPTNPSVPQLYEHPMDIRVYDTPSLASSAAAPTSSIAFLAHLPGQARMLTITEDQHLTLHKFETRKEDYIPPYTLTENWGGSLIGTQLHPTLRSLLAPSPPSGPAPSLSSGPLPGNLSCLYWVSSCERYLVSCGYWDHSLRVTSLFDNTTSGLGFGDLISHHATNAAAAVGVGGGRGAPYAPAVIAGPTPAVAAVMGGASGSGVGKLVAVINDAHRDVISCVAGDGLGDLLVTGSFDCTLKVWGLAEFHTAGGTAEIVNSNAVNTLHKNVGLLNVSQESKMDSVSAAASASASLSASASTFPPNSTAARSSASSSSGITTQSLALLSSLPLMATPLHVICTHMHPIVFVAADSALDIIVSIDINNHIALHSLRTAAYIRHIEITQLQSPQDQHPTHISAPQSLTHPLAIRWLGLCKQGWILLYCQRTGHTPVTEQDQAQTLKRSATHTHTPDTQHQQSLLMLFHLNGRLISSIPIKHSLTSLTLAHDSSWLFTASSSSSSFSSHRPSSTARRQLHSVLEIYSLPTLTAAGSVAYPVSSGEITALVASVGDVCLLSNMRHAGKVSIGAVGAHVLRKKLLSH